MDGEETKAEAMDGGMEAAKEEAMEAAAMEGEMEAAMEGEPGGGMDAMDAMEAEAVPEAPAAEAEAAPVDTKTNYADDESKLQILILIYFAWFSMLNFIQYFLSLFHETET